MARILIAEDDDIVRAFLVRALGGEGHDLTETADGSTALDALNASNGKFDLLLSDVKMPGMDGIELALATGRHHPDVAIMLMTGYADQRERAHGLDALVDHGYLAEKIARRKGRAFLAADENLRLAGFDDEESGPARATPRPGRARARCNQQAVFCRSDHVRRARSIGAAPLIRNFGIRNPSASARCSRARVAGGSSRQSVCATPLKCGAHAERRSRPALSP